MAEKPFLSVVIPSYNEKINLDRHTLEQAYEYLHRQSYAWEIVLTDDGSTDGTLQELYAFAEAHPHVRVLENAHRGKGPTVYEGMMAAKGDLRLYTDFDQATPLSEIEKLFPFAEKQYEVILGSREVQGARREREPLHRHVMGKVFNLCVKLLTVEGIQDTQCGFKLFTDTAVVALFPSLYIYRPGSARSDAFTGAFDVELLYLAKKKKLKIAEVPVSWKYAKTNRVDPIKDSTRMFIDLLRIRFADLQGKYSQS